MRQLRFVAALVLASGIHGPVLGDDLPPPEYVMHDLGAVAAIALDDAGRIAATTVSGMPRGYVLTLDGADLRSSDVPSVAPGGFVSPHDISDGTVVGQSYAGPAPAGGSGVVLRAFSNTGGTTTDLGFLQIPEAGAVVYADQRASTAYGIGPTGIVVGESSGTVSGEGTGLLIYRAFRSEGGAMTQLTTDLSRALAVNSAGSVVGWKRIGFVQRATLWTGAAQYDIDAADSYAASPYDINDRGQVVGSRTVSDLPNPPRSRAFLTQLSGTTVASDTLLPVLSDARRESLAQAINESGVIVGWSSTGSELGASHAVRWKDGVLADLNTLIDPASPAIADNTGINDFGFELHRAVDVNESGDIVCVGQRTFNGVTAARSYLLRPVLTGLSVSPRVLDFGDVAAGGSATRTVTVTNSTNAALTVKLKKPKKPLTADGDTSFSLGVRESRQVTVQVAPRETGGAAGTLRIGAAKAATIELPLSVRGVPPLVASPSPLEFGTVRGHGQQTVTLTNLTDAPMRATLSGLKKPFSIVGPRTVEILPQSSVDVDLAMEFPAARSYASGLLVKASTAKAAPVKLVVTGAGTSTCLVRNVTGEVTRRRGVGDFEVITGDVEIGEDEEIATGVESGAVLTTPDGSTLTLHELTQIRAATLVLTEDARNVRIQLKIGEIQAEITPRKTLETNFDIKMPTATASVRGTVFETIYDEATQTATVRVTEGLVLVTPTDPGLKKVKVPAGKQVTVTPVAISPLSDLP